MSKQLGKMITSGLQKKMYILALNTSKVIKLVDDRICSEEISLKPVLTYSTFSFSFSGNRKGEITSCLQPHNYNETGNHQHIHITLFPHFILLLM